MTSCRARSFLIALLCASAAASCSIKKIAIGSLADTLASSGEVFASDEDPELIRAAVPFSLKTVETLLAEVPTHPGLLLTACSGFTQYAYAFIQLDAELIEEQDYQAAATARERALKMYLRARGYCLRRFELTHKGIGARLSADPKPALAGVRADAVPLLYWTGASWGAAIALGLDRPELIADMPAVRALMDRALELDEDFARGAIHEALIALDALPESMGGSVERARQHFARAVELTGGMSAGPFVSLAGSVSVPEQNRAEFEKLLNQALAIDPAKEPSMRLANVITQRRARHLLSRVDDLFSGEAGNLDQSSTRRHEDSMLPTKTRSLLANEDGVFVVHPAPSCLRVPAMAITLDGFPPRSPTSILGSPRTQRSPRSQSSGSQQGDRGFETRDSWVGPSP